MVSRLIGWMAQHQTKFHSDGREKLKEAIVGKAIEAVKVLELE